MGLTFAIVILVLTFVLAWSTRHDRDHNDDHIHDLEFLDPESRDPANHG